MKTALTIALVAAFAVFSVAVKNELLGDKNPLQTIKVGEPMPDFTLSQPSGQKLVLSEVVRENKLVMINFWASWCGPCRVEMPGFEKLYTAKKQNGLTILGVNEDEERPKMEAYLTERPVSFPILVDERSELMRRLGVRVLPTTILVGGDGKVRLVYEGVQSYVEFMVDAELKAPAKAQ